MNLGFGRVFRKLGLPAWTFIGVGISGIWFSYAGALLERFLRVWWQIDEKTTGVKAYLPQLALFGLPLVVIVLLPCRVFTTFSII